jgi:hypothetical protein
VNVTFTFQQGPRTVNLIVPLLTIVPVPYIRIDTLTIDFIANISAESSTSFSESASSAFEGSVSASAKWLFFSASFDASYSSKKDSTGTANSSYSVEYTMNVAVRASQDSLPAGLASILNILQESIATANPEGTVTIYTSSDTVSTDNTTVDYEAIVVNGANKPVEGVTVTASIEGDAALIAQLAFASTTETTNKYGAAKGFALTYTPASPPVLGTAKIVFTATVDGEDISATQELGVE